MTEKLLKRLQKKRQNYHTQIIDSFADDRLKEIQFLNNMYLLLGLGRRLPFIPSRQVPTSMFYEEADVISQISEDMEEKNRVPRFVQGINTLINIIGNAFPMEVLKTINTHSNHIKILSDLPIEWMDINGVPLYLNKSISRIPITQVDDLLHYHEVASIEYELSVNAIKILIINTLSPDELLFKYGRLLSKSIKYYFKPLNINIQYVEADTKKRFIQAINKFKPTIMIYYGHGGYDRRTMKGVLEIRRKEIIGEEEIAKLKSVPLITILGACKTHVLNGAYQNIANMMLRKGCVAVLGTYFPVNGEHALFILLV